MKKVGRRIPSSLNIKPHENFRGYLAQSFLKTFGQNLSALAISDHLKKISPGQNGTEFRPPPGLFQLCGGPTPEPFC